MRRRVMGLLVPSVMLLAGCTQGGLDPRGPGAQRIDDVTMTMTIVSVAVTLVVFGAWWWAVARKGSSNLSDPSADHLQDAALEQRFVIGGGIVMPGVVLVVLFVLGVWTMAMVPQDSDIDIDVVGHQFWWEVTYQQVPDADVAFETANQVVVPVGVDVTLRLRSEDVIHSFSVPQLAGKVDLVPGRETRLTFSASEPGTYEGYCAEFCGLQHAWMKFEVVALQPEDFSAWVATQAAAASEPTTAPEVAGRDVFISTSCAACHAIRGVAEAGDLGPDLTHLASRNEIGAGVMALTEANLAAWVSNAQQVKGGSQMPPQDLPPDELDAVVAYLLGLD